MKTKCQQPNRTCLICGERFYARPSASRATCGSDSCKLEYKKISGTLIKGSHSGQRNNRWNGGQLITCGYKMILSPGHPNRDRFNYVKEHRLVVEAAIDRYLSKDEVVHHRNHNKLDNRLENLMIFENQVAHLAYHRTHKEPEGDWLFVEKHEYYESNKVNN